MFALIFILSITQTNSLVFNPECAWLETSQQDFKDGYFERNIYASHRGGGAVEFAPRFDLDNNGYIDVMIGGDNNYAIWVYWGSTSGYDPNRRTSYARAGGGNCDGGDLNTDGFPDLLVTQWDLSKVSVYWGTAAGPDPNRRTDIACGAQGNEACFIADFNKDGYLDIVVDVYTLSACCIFWGSATGFNPSHRTELPATRAGLNLEVGDFNKDNWLDLLVVNVWSSTNYVYWGDPSGFSSSRVTALPYTSGNPHGASAADLNRDGYLDLVFSGNPQAYIYWGSRSGYSASSRQIVNPGPTFGGNNIADLNNDGFLDIIFIEDGRTRVYWGSAAGYSDQNVRDIGPSIFGAGGTVADYNLDGNLDVFIDNNQHYANSYIIYGPEFNTWLGLPCDGDHHITFREIGNIYDRKYCEDYCSSVFDAGFSANWGRLVWKDSLAVGSLIKVYLRSGKTPVPDSTWSEWVEVPNGGNIPDELNARYLQYQAKLFYLSPARLPVLCEVKVTYGTAVSACVDIDPNTINMRSVGKPITGYIELSGHKADSINVRTVKLEFEGNVVNANLVPSGVGDHNGNGVEDMMVKFDRQRVISILKPGVAVITVSGSLIDGTNFSGQDTVMVIDPSDKEVSGGVYPNPLKSKSTISLYHGDRAVDCTGPISVQVFDVSGRRVKTLLRAAQPTGQKTVVWDGRSDNGGVLPNGIYYVQIRTTTKVASEKIMIMR